MHVESLESSLKKHFDLVDQIILSRQDPITGLLPASTAVNAHGDYTDAWVRDNVYSILSVWGLALAYRKFDPEHHRTYLLSQSVVKLMRGLLTAMMRQSDRIEVFKKTHNPIDALHAKYGTKTGLAVVGDDEWGHLQLDASSLFLLMVAQMTASGLHIVYTMDEVDFVQNMVHYISHTYCTPDYGIWERGNKINHGNTEVNGSSVGMAKAALEALDGFNLFADIPNHEAVIHVIPSDIARSRFTLQGLLPRESNSKETDAALLSIIGYPAYAVEDIELVKRTRDKIIKKLAGNYGCKRFLLDGHQSSIEDASRLHYEPSELREFEHIESEWPLFFTYLLLDALIRGENEEVEHWRHKLQPLFVEQEGKKLLPELYIVPKESIDAEKEDPGSQMRVANENIPLVWAQSLYMLSDMMLDGLLDPEDIDPLKRHKRIGHRFSVKPLVPVIAENRSVKEKLAALGFESETIEEIKPVRIIHADQLSMLHTFLGQNKKLSLSGRELMVARTMTTARVHVYEGEEIIFLPYYFNPHGFYFSADNILLVEHFRASLRFLAVQWDVKGQPVIPFFVRESMFSAREREALVELLENIQKEQSGTVAIQTGPLKRLLGQACMERIDHIHGFTLQDADIVSKDDRLRLCSKENETDAIRLSPEEIEYLGAQDDALLIEILLGEKNRLYKTCVLEELWRRKGADFEFHREEGSITLSQVAQDLYESATVCHEWNLVRRIADLTEKYDDRIEDVLLDIVIRQKRLAVGRAYSGKATFSKPHESIDIVKTIIEFCGNNTAESVLTQEIILHLGYMIRNEPELFENMLTIRTWYFIQLLVGQISREENLHMADAYEKLISLAPHTIYERLYRVLKTFKREVSLFLVQENLHARVRPSFESIKIGPRVSEFREVTDWQHWRQQRGMVGPLSPVFYKDIWYLLRQCSGLVIGDKYNVQNRIGSELTLESTAGEQSFALKIDALLQSIDAPDYRQLNIELIESLARLFRENPDLHLEDDLIMDVLIGHAVRISWEKNSASKHYNEQRSEAWKAFYQRSPVETDKAFLEAFMFLLSPQDSLHDLTV
ncbi:glycoside hydrolase family 15 protein [Sulfurovum sp. XGS-02]|uniref:glycoside hydrolase family 15 protein n=1 Tax=Sulfurovum sp. XGS-02 TaxID=2925411 RepID=UPI002049B11E|nr:glycoside hydrolase family 15 protein [Sulfurovum sp. XGS-02]UPT76644.1 glycoside hydrolase family 15 protein [Sulfurovum sp. XGS-02]